MNGGSQFLGIVQNGVLQLLSLSSALDGAVQPISIPVQVARSLESTEYEG